jgi:hypothetical protein
MPLSFRPSAKVWIWLNSDAGIELDKRPKFLTSVLTCEQADAWSDSLQELIRNKGTYEDVANLLMTHISDWANFSEPFSSAAIKRTLTRKELWELAIGLPEKVGLSEDTLPLSVSPSPTGGVACVSNAAAPVKTPQANASHS